MTSQLLVPQSANEAHQARTIFSDRYPLAQRYIQHLASSGIERGLIGPRETARLWNRHVLNCAVLEEVIPKNITLADIGSGAGLPGICLAIARKDLRITLVEPLERRIAWLTEVIADLKLDHQITIFHGRAEEIAGKFRYDVVTARALAPLKQLIRLAVPLLRKNGTLLAIKGQAARKEIDEAQKVFRQYPLQAPEILTIGNFLEQPTTLVRITSL